MKCNFFNDFYSLYISLLKRPNRYKNLNNKPFNKYATICVNRENSEFDLKYLKELSHASVPFSDAYAISIIFIFIFF
jgi:hypothetical protein